MKAFAVSLLLVIVGLGMANAQYKINKTYYSTDPVLISFF